MTLSTWICSATLLAITTAPLAAQTATPATALSAADSTHLMELGHTYTRWLLAGRADSLAGAARPEFLNAIGGAAGLTEQVAMLAEHAGEQTKVLADKMTRRNGKPQYWHEGEFALFTNEPLVLRFILDAEGKISGLGIAPKSRSPSDQ
jgi:hypothetical protein